MVKEFNLSEKMVEDITSRGNYPYYHEEDVKEFIKIIKEDFELFKLQQFGIGVGMSPKFNVFLEMINKRAGNKLL